MFNEFLDELYFEVNGSIMKSNICIWCGKTAPLTKSHIFPECLGIRFYGFTTCGPCNSFFGENVEGTIMNNAFFTAAMVVIGLKSRKDAYKRAKKVDTKSGYDVIINKQGMVEPIPKMISETKFVGTPQQLKEKAVKQFTRKSTHKSIKPIEDFYDDHSKNRFEYEGVIYSKEITPKGKTEIKISLARDPDPKLVFKIAYEFLIISGLMRVPEIKLKMSSLYRIYYNENKLMVLFSSELSERYITNTTHTFRNYKQLEKIPFMDYHFAMLRISRKQILYVEIVFFGQIKTIFIIGQVKTLKAHTLSMLDNGLVFKIGEFTPSLSQFPNFLRARESKLSDVIVEVRHWEIQERNKKISNESNKPTQRPIS